MQFSLFDMHNTVLIVVNMELVIVGIDLTLVHVLVITSLQLLVIREIVTVVHHTLISRRTIITEETSEPGKLPHRAGRSLTGSRTGLGRFGGASYPP